jgi:hypothetical protein
MQRYRKYNKRCARVHTSSPVLLHSEASSRIRTLQAGRRAVRNGCEEGENSLYYGFGLPRIGFELYFFGFGPPRLGFEIYFFGFALSSLVF